jgi:carboxymethylenebutenolidase
MTEAPAHRPKSQRGKSTRREFMLNLLAGGFALAVQPVSAQTVVTDLKGLSAGDVELATADRPIPAYHAMPATGGPFPIVLVVQEIFGVHEHIRDVCRRLAKAGYLAVAPQLFARQGEVGAIAEVHQILREVVARVPDKQVMGDLDAAVGWATTLGRGDAARVGITGFCWGGRITWLYCMHNRKVKAGVAWYGRLTGQETELTPRQPLDIAPKLAVPVLGLYGGADTGIPLEQVEQMRAALAKGGSGSEIHVYPDAPHAFFADYRPSYRKEAAEDGWNRMLAWFRSHGVEAPPMTGRRRAASDAA